MRQKISIALSVILLLVAVWMIARDLFRGTRFPMQVSCCNDDLTPLKKIDSILIGYESIRVIETAARNLSGITVDDNNTIFVTGNGLVIAFDEAGNRIDEFRVDTVSGSLAVRGNDLFISSGSDIIYYKLTDGSSTKWFSDNNRGYLTSLAINGEYVYAADAERKIILKYDFNGSMVQELGRKDTLTEAPGFILPSLYFDLAFGGFNDLWVANTGRLKVENYTLKGNFQSGWGEASFEPGGFSGCCNPAHLTLLPDGCFVTYEKGLDQIKVFDQTGKFLNFVGGAGSFKGNTDFQLGMNNLVKDLTAGYDGKIYVLDAYNRINVFQKKDN